MKQARRDRRPGSSGRRTVEATPEEVWEALTDEDRLEEWLARGRRARSDRGRRDRRPRRRRRALRHRRDRRGGRAIRLHLVAARRGRELRRVHDRGAARRHPGHRGRDADLRRHEHRAGDRDGGRRLGAAARAVCTVSMRFALGRLRAPGAPTRRRGLRRARRSDAPAGGGDPRPRRHGDGERPRGAAADHAPGRRQAPRGSARRRARHARRGSAARPTTSSGPSRSTRRPTGSRW